MEHPRPSRVGQLTIAIVIQRHDSWPTVDPHAGREGRLEVEDYSPSCEEQASSLALQGAGRLLDHTSSRSHGTQEHAAAAVARVKQDATSRVK